MPPAAAEPGTLDAGDFHPWLDAVRLSLSDGRPMDVPCGSCDACCRSSRFVHVAPDETETLARIPRELLVAAPGLPDGHRVMGYDEHGRCPLLGERGCTIYEQRPRTCRTYDCRVFAATGVDAGNDQPLIARQAARWRFRYASEDDRRAHVELADYATALAAETAADGPAWPATAIALRALTLSE